MELRKDIRVATITLTDEFGDAWTAYGVFEKDNLKPTHIARPRRVTSEQGQGEETCGPQA